MLIHLPKSCQKREDELKQVTECLIRASLNEKEFKMFQLKSTVDKREVVRKLESELRMLLEALKEGKIKGKLKSKQKFYNQTKFLYQNLVECSNRTQEEVEQLLKNLLCTKEHDDYFLLGLAALKVGKLVGFGVGGSVGGLAGKAIGKKAASRHGEL